MTNINDTYKLPVTKTLLELQKEQKSIQLGWGNTILDEYLSPISLGLTEIVGEAGVGKTQLLLQLAIQAQEPYNSLGLNGAVAMVITENNLSTKRLHQILEERKKKSITLFYITLFR